MKYVYVNNTGLVTGVVHIDPSAGGQPVGPAGSTIYKVDNSVQVKPEDFCTLENGVPSFAPFYTPNIVSIGVFLLSITSGERSALRKSQDALVAEFVASVTDPRITEIDLNDPGVQFDVQYAAGLVNAPPGTPNAGKPIASVCIGLNGDGEARATAILGGNLLAATS